MGYDVADFIPCEVCHTQAVDIHHIEARGMGGTKKVDTIDNLIALCRECHIKLGDKKEYKDFLQDIVKKRGHTDRDSNKRLDKPSGQKYWRQA
jgi:hypothetical protein